ncbi:ectoine/hydroxyectoine ABC transporter permease subunit EhuD, partial [filamentous cyanobacterium CCP5]
MAFDFGFAIEILPALLQATLVTIAATLLGSVIALTLGLGMALARRSPQPWLSKISGALIDFIRNTPLLVQIYFVFYVLPNFGVTLPPFWAGSIAIGLHYSTYTSEVYRAGLDGVPKGQWEAGMALGM